MSFDSEILSKLALLAGPKSHDHALFEDGNKHIKHLKKFGIFESDNEDFLHEPVQRFSCNIYGCKRTFDTVFEFEQHYNCCHRYTCAECRKILATAHLLDLHVSETHDSFFMASAERKPMYACFLEDCKTVYLTAQLRKSHCLEAHNFAPSFWSDKPVEKYNKPKAPSKKPSTASHSSQNPKPKLKKPIDSEEANSMEIDTKQKESKPKHLGRFGKGHQKILSNFTKDLDQSLPEIKTKSTNPTSTSNLSSNVEMID